MPVNQHCNMSALTANNFARALGYTKAIEFEWARPSTCDRWKDVTKLQKAPHRCNISVMQQIYHKILKEARKKHPEQLVKNEMTVLSLWKAPKGIKEILAGLSFVCFQILALTELAIRVIVAVGSYIGSAFTFVFSCEKGRKLAQFAMITVKQGGLLLAVPCMSYIQSSFLGKKPESARRSEPEISGSRSQNISTAFKGKFTVCAGSRWSKVTIDGEKVKDPTELWFTFIDTQSQKEIRQVKMLYHPDDLGFFELRSNVQDVIRKLICDENLNETNYKHTSTCKLTLDEEKVRSSEGNVDKSNTLNLLAYIFCFVDKNCQLQLGNDKDIEGQFVLKIETGQGSNEFENLKFNGAEKIIVQKDHKDLEMMEDFILQHNNKCSTLRIEELGEIDVEELD